LQQDGDRGEDCSGSKDRTGGEEGQRGRRRKLAEQK